MSRFDIVAMQSASHPRKLESSWSQRLLSWARFRVDAPEDPFERVSLFYLMAIGLVALYVFVLLTVSDELLPFRAAGALAMTMLMVVWWRIHRDDRDLLWVTPFEAAGVVVIALGVGGALQVLGVIYVAVYFRAIRGGVRRAVSRSLVLAGAYAAVIVWTRPGSFAVVDVAVNTMFALPLVAVTNALLGGGLRRSGHDQAALQCAHDEIRRSHRRMAEAEMLAGVGSWEWDLIGGEVHISEGLMTMTRLTTRSPSFEEWTARVHPDDVPMIRAALSRLLRGVEDPASAEYRMVWPDGEVRHVLSRARRVFDERGEVVAAMGTIHDITDYRNLDQELARQQELSEMKSRFLSTVSHELRTPLTSLIGFTETLLADDWDRETETEFLQLMHVQGAELQSLIEDLITFGRVEADELTLAVRRVDLRLEVESVLAGFAERGRRVDVDVPEGTTVAGDPLRVRQIIRNLLDNAFKYGAAPVTIRAGTEQGIVVCRVADSGPGIDPRHAEAIFEPYRRLVDDRTMSLPGVGLGLPLCRMLADRQNGSLRYTADGDLPAFELVLPAA